MLSHKEKEEIEAIKQSLTDQITLAVVDNLRKFEKGKIVEEYQKLLKMKGSRVCIYDNKLENVVREGIFLGVNEYGFALIEDQGNVAVINEGRMREKKTV